MKNISVIIPMYNAEKYIGECLESIFAQTFQDFEIIVVDDCSTDNSCAVVEKFIKTHVGGGDLKLVRRKINSGGPSISRNCGLELSRGKYIFFMDNDDLLVKTALEELFNLAEQFQAEVIYCDRCGTFQDKENILVDNKPYFVKSPVLIPEDLPGKIQAHIQGRFRPEPWLKFSLRDFLIENEIRFGTYVQEDSIWTISLLIAAKRFLISPNVCYLYRNYPEQLSKLTHMVQNQDNTKKALRILQRSIYGIKDFDNFLNKTEFLKNHTEWRYALLSNVLNRDISWALESVAHLPPHEIYEMIQNEFKKDFGEYDILISSLISANMMTMKNFIISQQKLRSLAH